jgi:uncharacterized surface protein with fasciclin (FAS1) repeats
MWSLVPNSNDNIEVSAMRKHIVGIFAAVATVSVLMASVSVAGNYGKTKATAAGKSGMDIVQVAKSAGTFNTLLTALKATDLDKTLKGKGPFTVFAPTDEAFAKLPAGALDGLLKDPAALKNVLLFHVVSGKVMAKDVVALTEAPTANGQKVSINTANGVVLNGTSNVVKTDIPASNGVIHVIDTVLLPAAK